MELAIDPTHLSAASVALIRCASTLDDAAMTFARQACSELPHVGFSAAEAAQRGIVAAERAVQVITSDIDRLAQALSGLAGLYPRVDASAVRTR